MATLYLSTTGSDAYSYAQAQSPSTPWLTIGKVASTGVDGDTVIVADGTYTVPAGQTTWTIDINWVAENELLAIFDHDTANVTWKNRSHTFTGIKFINVFSTTNEGLFNGAGPSFTRCQLGTHTTPMLLAGTGTTGSFNRNALKVAFDTCLVYAQINTGASSKTCSFIFSNPSASWVGTEWKNTTFIFNGTTLGDGQFASILGASGGAAGVYLTVTDCILYAGNTATLWETGNWIDSNVTNTYSCYYNITSPVSGTGVISSDPLFRDIDNGNVNLRPSSPCIDGGTTV